ncbi:hypothetical protein CBM2634_U20020 [Cupriavidus taiwanensis]|uniref:Transposase IS200-like domain-containing protein n=1 Tax=Cupriavidus taiwanensis TaxID=164546 RepID=A0A375JBP8_9BURK|nr:hypothetical protein CBM2634_U20020 [Cupriavidus taiwanensis]
MSDDNDVRHRRHCIFLLHVHLVFVTKYRREVFTRAILDDLRDIFTGICADFEAELVEFDGEDDHVHLLVNCPPKVAVSAAAAVRPSRSFANTLSNNRHRINRRMDAYGVRAILPRPSGLSFTHKLWA